MKDAKKVYQSVKLTDDVNTMSLGVSDQLRIMFSKISNDEVAELHAEEKVNEDYYRKYAALSTFIDKATTKMAELKETSVTVLISSELLPCLSEVIDPVHGKGQYYTFDLYKDDTPIELTKCMVVRIHLKGGKNSEDKIESTMFSDVM